MSSELNQMSAVELRWRIARKEISPVEVTERALAKAEETQRTLHRSTFHTFLEVKLG